MVQKTIVIVGGGFAGVACGKRLRSRLHPGEARIILFSEENYMVFQPLLAEVAGSSILPEATATPLRVALPGVECRREKVVDILLAENRLVYETFEGIKRSLDYDQIVVACGSGVNLTAVPGMADHALPFRTVADAVRLRTQISQQLEQAAVEESTARRQFFLTFAVIGGGFSGVEVAGEINDLVNAAEKWYPTINPKESRVILIHGREELLQEVSPPLREFTRRKMADNGVEIVLGKRVKLVTAEGVTLSDGTHFPAATVVGTTGTAPHPFVERMAAAKDKGRLKTRPDMRLEGFDNAWAVGDCALILNAYNNEPAQPTGQLAEREGKQCAANIVRALAGEPTQPFYFKPLGLLCAIGGHNAVAEIMGFKLSGFFTWWVWRTVYLMKLPTLSRKVKVAMDWTWELLFSRDITSVKVDSANRIHDAYIPAGSFVFKAGDPATDFYVIEKGEVEVLRQLDPAREPERLAVFGAGDFFGEMALLEDRLHQASVRARTDVELTVIGKGMFARMSKVLAPLANHLELAIRRRTKIRQKLPQSTAILEGTSMQECLEPLPSSPIAQTTPMAEVLTHFEQQKTDFFCVVDADGQLSGVLTRTDLLSAIERMAMLDEAERSGLTVADIMTPNPLYATASDSALIVAEMMRERSLKRLPVVAAPGELKLIGYVRLEILMSLVLRRLGQL